MGARCNRILGFSLAIAVLGALPARAFQPGDDQYPNSIMAPEPGTAIHRRGAVSSDVKNPPAPVKSFARRHAGKRMYVTRGSSGSVLPTPLPRTTLIPPEGGGMPVTHALPQEQDGTIIPGGTTSIPNLPHGSETFQDRASRCALQAGLNGVPNNAGALYMNACAM